MNVGFKTIAVLAFTFGISCTGFAAEPELAAARGQVTRIGAVAYSPAAVTIFHGLTRYLDKNGLPADYVLYSNYDSLVAALERGEIDIAWNTPLAHAQYHVRNKGASQTLVMRDVDVGVRSLIVARTDAKIKSPAHLGGKKLVLGSSQAAEATVLPLHYLKQEGVDLSQVKIISLDAEVDGQGNPCASPQHVLQALRDGRGDAGIITAELWNRVKDQPFARGSLAPVWTSPPFSHCVFTAAAKFDKERASRFTQLMQAMDPEASSTCDVMKLEGTKKWLPGSPEGFKDLVDALRDTKGGGEGKAKDTSARLARPKVRSFALNYRFRVKGLTSAGDATKDHVRIWLPCAASNESQEVTRLAATAPAELSEHKESRYGNPLLYTQFPIPPSGEFKVDVPYQIMRREVLHQAEPPAGPKAVALDDDQRALFVSADSLVPITGKPLKLLSDVDLSADKLKLARQLYNLVDDHVVYKKEGTGWGRGDTNWVCDSGFGNCTDFHSLFISLARSQGLPARFEIGFSIPTDKTAGQISGYHCWAWFYLDDRGWVAVDISEADKHPELKEYYFGNLTADRVMFSVGRDLELSPKPANRPLNFLIYPYIEVGGKPLPKENVELQFEFQDKP